MNEIAENVWHIPLMGRHLINAYVLGDVLVDAGMAGHGKKLRGKLGGHAIAAHTLTHAHPDHVGGSKNVVDALGIPFWAPAGEAAAVEAGQAVQKPTKAKQLLELTAKFKPVPIARRLNEGDEVGGFTVLDTPGHTLGHVSYVIPAAKVAFTADTLFSLGCGRVFEGTPAMMWASLEALMALPDETKVYCGHEYTQANARFALTIEPENADLVARAKEVDALRAAGRPTLPTTIGQEKRTNPFLRAGEPGIARNLGMDGAAPAEVFAEIRKRKDHFK